jgi:hypothetical protein
MSLVRLHLACQVRLIFTKSHYFKNEQIELITSQSRLTGLVSSQTAAENVVCIIRGDDR